MQRGPLSIIFVFVIVELLGFSLVLPLLPYYATAFQASCKPGGAPGVPLMPGGGPPVSRETRAGHSKGR